MYALGLIVVTASLRLERFCPKLFCKLLPILDPMFPKTSPPFKFSCVRPSKS